MAGNGSIAVTLKPGHPTARGLKTVVLTTSVMLLAVAATPQSPARRPFSQDANGPERAGQEVELTRLLRGRFPRPSIDASLPPSMKYQLRSAYDIAVRVLRTEPGCRSLFHRLGADGEDVLARSWYSDAGDGGYCQEAVPAFTEVGSTQIKLCRRFGELQVSAAAGLLLHEALHSSGLRESPAYPNALTSREINVEVSQGCKLK